MRHSDEKTDRLILELWTKTRIDWGFATDRIAEAFRKERSLGSQERRKVAETLYGMIRQARRVDFALGDTGLKGDRRERARLVAYRVLEGETSVAEAAATVPEIDWATVATVDERIAREKEPVRLALARSLPDWLAARFLAQLGPDEADRLGAALNQRAPLTVRVNLLRATREAVVARLAAAGITARPTSLAAAGLVLETRVNIFGLPELKEGLIEVQDEASQLVAELVAPPPKGLVVDACAGAGGKTLAIGAMLGNKGRIVSLDVDGRKLEELRRRARRAGLSNARAIEVDGGGYPDEVVALQAKADRVLVDAPCSGVGALRRNPEARWRLNEADVTRLARDQEAIARQAMSLVAPGGRLIYATCTILVDENERVVEKLVASAGPGWQVMRVAEIWGKERAGTLGGGTYLKMLPHVHDTDGFFAAVLRRLPV